MSENGISPISGLVMRGLQNPQNDFKIYEDPMPTVALVELKRVGFTRSTNLSRIQSYFLIRACSSVNVNAARSSLKISYGLSILYSPTES